MPTGLNIRDFTKNYRELRYANEGAIRLSEIEHNAYLNRLTVEITHFDAPRAINYKTNPENTHWGYLTSFKGSSVVENLPVKFAKQRVFEHINQGIWNYHESTENVRLTKVFSEASANSIISSEILTDIQGKVVDFYLSLISNLPDQIDEDLQWILSFTYRPDEPTQPNNQAYTAFPIASPFPDVFKFKSDIPTSFLFRLESWYLVNPAVYIVANPSDTSDETEGEDEYPEPTPGSGNGDSQEFPESSPNDPENDPRDGGQKPAPELDPEIVYTWIVTVNATAIAPPGVAVPYTVVGEVQALTNALPFSARAGQNEILNFQGESWKAGVDVLDRFGQFRVNLDPVSGIRVGSASVVSTVLKQT